MPTTSVPGAAIERRRLRATSGGARILTVVALLMAALAARPQLASGQPAGPDSLRGAQLLAALRGGGYILYFRHADTNFRQNDSRMRSVDDCANQRNLTDLGREHARAIGEALRALRIPIGPVLASPLCRTVETATLAFGRVERSDAVIETGPEAPGTPDRFSALRDLLSTAPPTGTNVVIVGHAYRFYSLVGGQYLEEGEAGIVRPTAGGFTEVARAGLAQWRELAKLE
jgi:phosphohistidine phosphatase SixA